MSKFFEDTMQGLLEAVAIEKGELPVVKRENMPSPTYYVEDVSHDLIDQIVKIRKNENISQKDLAKMTGSTQQAISRFEQKAHNSSVTLFVNIIHALGYDIQFVKRSI